MAHVRLYRDEIEEKTLPFVCLRCGRPASVWKTLRFVWNSSSFLSLFLFGEIALAAGKTRPKKLQLPMCRAHRNHWFGRALFTWGVGGVVLVGFFAGLAVLAEPRQVPLAWREILAPVFGFSFLGLLVWLPIMLILHRTSIRPIEVDENCITLTGVAPEFRKRLRAMRDKADDAAEERLHVAVQAGRYNVVGIPTEGGPKRVLKSFDDAAKAEECAAFFKGGSAYLEVAVEETHQTENESRRRETASASRRRGEAQRGRNKSKPWLGRVAGAAVVILGVAAVMIYWAMTRESEPDRMVRLVKETLKKEGVEAAFEPVVQITGQGDQWSGTATFGEIVYGIRTFRDKNGKLMLERTRRPQIVPNAAPALPTRPDFSGVDYAVDFHEANCAKGPEGQAVFVRHLPYQVGQKIYPQKLQGYVRLNEQAMRQTGTDSLIDGRTLMGVIGLGTSKPGHGTLAAAMQSLSGRFVAYGKQTVFYPANQLPGKKAARQPQKFLEDYIFDGKRHGPYTDWYTNGQMKAQAIFKDGQRHGLLVRWNADGNKEAEEHYLDGKMHGLERGWHGDGKPSFEGAWVDGRRQGPWKKWDKNGTEQVAHWTNGTFDRRINSRNAFIWALNLAADGVNRAGELVFQDAKKFGKVFGSPDAWMVQSPPTPRLDIDEVRRRAAQYEPPPYYPGPALGKPKPIFQTHRPGGQEWHFRCADGTLGLQVEDTGGRRVIRLP